MIRPRQIRLKLNKSTFQHCQQLSEESAHVWNTVKNFFWRTYRKKGIWLSESSLKCYIQGRFALHSQSIQAVGEKFCDNLKTAYTLRKENSNIRYPYKNKNWFCVHWKKSAIKVKGRYIHLSNGKSRQGIIFKLPNYLSDCQPNCVELICSLRSPTPSAYGRNGYWLSITLEGEGSPREIDDLEHPRSIAIISRGKQQLLGFNTTAVDMGEIHAVTITDGKEAVVISGRQLRSVKHNRNKRVAHLSRLQSRCKKDSRRWKRLQAVKSKVMASCHRRTRDLNHKITRLAINWCIEHNIEKLVIGDVSGISKNTKKQKRLNRSNRQKISQWAFYQQRQYLEYKCEEVGIETVLESENSTSKTCPRCGNKNKPIGRNYNCPACNLKIHRDVVGAVNIRTKHQIASQGSQGVLNGNDNFKSPTVKYLRIDHWSKSSSVAGVNPWIDD